MKTNFYRLLVLLFALVGAVALAGWCQADTDTNTDTAKFKQDAQAALQKSEDAAKDAAAITKQKAAEIATNVEAHAKPYVEKASEVATNVAAETKVEIIPWSGRCVVHEQFTAAEVRQVREDHPGVVVLVHPECQPEVVAEADFSGSTAAMSRYVDERRPAEVVLLTECSMSDNVAVSHPEVEFVRPCNLCPHMKRITLAKIRKSLEQNLYEVTVDPAVAGPARRAVERMIAL